MDYVRLYRMADKAAIMTVVVSAGVDESQRVLMGMPDLFITLDPDTNRILSYTDAPDGGSVCLHFLMLHPLFKR